MTPPIARYRLRPLPLDETEPLVTKESLPLDFVLAQAGDAFGDTLDFCRDARHLGRDLDARIAALELAYE